MAILIGHEMQKSYLYKQVLILNGNFFTQNKGMLIISYSFSSFLNNFVESACLFTSKAL